MDQLAAHPFEKTSGLQHLVDPLRHIQLRLPNGLFELADVRARDENPRAQCPLCESRRLPKPLQLGPEELPCRLP
jgi:hypothetical protein